MTERRIKEAEVVDRDAASAVSVYGKLIDKSKSAIDSDSNWLITLSDVLSLLLVFFIMFFVTTKRDLKGKEAQTNVNPGVASHGIDLTPAVVAAKEQIKNEVDSVIKDLDIENDDVSVQTVEKGVVITLKEKVAFRPGEAEIRRSSEPILGHIARIIQKYSSYMVEIDGHTDSVPIKTRLYPSNWELSVARATSVLKYFINDHGIDPSRFFIKGNADRRPIVENDTPGHRAQNRRVEIRLKEMEAQM